MADLPPMATPRVAAGALIRSESGQIVVVKPTYKDAWDIPGGYVEPGESPRAACNRELMEEIGVARDLGGLLVVDWAPHPAEGDKLLFIFDGGLMSEAEAAALKPDGDEIGSVAFHPLAEAAAMMPDRLARRLALAVSAAEAGYIRYAEHGFDATPAGGQREAIVLVAGDKSGRWDTWYRQAVPIADQRFDEHLKTLHDNPDTNRGKKKDR